jgi:hypothetical protein
MVTDCQHKQINLMQNNIVSLNGVAPGSLRLDSQTQFCIKHFGKNVSSDTTLKMGTTIETTLLP